MIRPDHPVVRAMAEEMATEWCNAYDVSWAGTEFPPKRPMSTAMRVMFVALLTDFTRPATRDAWIRWGRKFALDAVLSGDPDRILRDGPSVARWGEHLRDNPAALEAAVSAALETM